MADEIKPTNTTLRTDVPANAPPVEDTIEADRAPSEFSKRQLKRQRKAAEAETERVAEEGRLPANAAIANPAPASAADMTAGGAFVEPDIKNAIPVDHPSVENNPREGTSAVQNGADFNEPFGRHPLDPEFAGQGLDLSVYGKK